MTSFSLITAYSRPAWIKVLKDKIQSVNPPMPLHFFQDKSPNPIWLGPPVCPQTHLLPLFLKLTLILTDWPCKTPAYNASNKFAQVAASIWVDFPQILAWLNPHFFNANVPSQWGFSWPCFKKLWLAHHGPNWPPKIHRLKILLPVWLYLKMGPLKISSKQLDIWNWDLRER